MPNNYAMREVSDLTFIDPTTKKPFLYMDYALTSNNEFSGSTEYARGGKNSPKRQAFDGEKESTLKVSTQVFDWRFISLLSGATVTTGAVNVFKREVLVSTGTTEVTVTLSETPVADTITIFLETEDAMATKEKTATVVGSTATITGGITATNYVAYYQFQSEATAEKISFKSNVFPATCQIIGDTLIKNDLGVNEPFQMVVYKAKAQPTFSITQASSGSPSTLDITFDIFSDSSNNMVDYIKY